jgi:mannose-6-phosphate isomerase-like protein (cupin superfamily)
MAPRGVNLAERFSRFTEQWSPKVVARLNDCEIKIVRIQGEFVWHTHDDTDELFLVLAGELTIRLRDGDVVLIEPTGVVNTGDAGGPLTAGYDDSLV